MKNIYYHITSINKLHTGDVIEFGKEYNNFYKEMVNIKHYNSSGKDANDVLLDLFNNKSLVFKSINDLKTVLNTVNDDAFILRELVFEHIRKCYFPECPSRFKCMYVLKDKDEVNGWLEIFKRINRKPLQIVKLELEGDVFEGNASLILRQSNSINDKIIQAKKTSSNEVWDEINTINLLEKCSILVYTYINFMKWEEYYEK